MSIIEDVVMKSGGTPQVQHTTRYMPTAKMKLHPSNPRFIKDRDFDILCQSIQNNPDFFEARPLLCTPDLVVFAGNMRLRAAKALKPKHVPVIIMDVDEEKQRELMVRDNVNNGQWDTDALAAMFEIPELAAWGMPEFVFSEATWESDGVEHATQPEAKDDEFKIPETIKTDIVRGDLFEIGPHRLLCGDSTSADDVARLTGGETVEILFTSPPYLEMRKYNGGKDLTLDVLIKFIPAWATFARFLCINLGLHFKDSEVVPYWDDYLDEAKSCGLKLVAWNVWDKTMGGSIASATNMFLLTHEWIFVFGSERKRLNRTILNQADKYEARHGKLWRKGINKTFRNETDTMEATTSATYERHQLHSVVQQTPELGKIRSSHPATFPVGLPAKYIEAMTDQRDIVGESFLGSGTTMVAAHQLNRKCYGMEIDEKYCQVIVDRMLKLDPALEIKRNGKPYEYSDKSVKNGERG